MSKLNKGAKAAKENGGRKEKSVEEVSKEIKIDLSCWISNLEELQGELIEAVDSGKQKSIPRIEKDILALKSKIRSGMNTLSGIDSTRDYEEILKAARDILEQKAKDKEPTASDDTPVPEDSSQPNEKSPSNVQDKIPVKAKATTPFNNLPKKSSKKIPKLTAAQKASLRKLKSKEVSDTPQISPKTTRVRKPVSSNIFDNIKNSEAPLSERLMMLRGIIEELVLMTETLIEDNPFSKRISNRAQITWLPYVKAALDIEGEGEDYCITSTIEDIREVEIDE